MQVPYNTSTKPTTRTNWVVSVAYTSTFASVTNNDFVSPVIDTRARHLTCTKNLIDNPKKDEERFGVKTSRLSSSLVILAPVALTAGD